MESPKSSKPRSEREPSRARDEGLRVKTQIGETVKPYADAFGAAAKPKANAFFAWIRADPRKAILILAGIILFFILFSPLIG